MDDSHPVAWLLMMCFGDEESDAAALRDLEAQLSVYTRIAPAFRRELDRVVAERNAADAIALVEEFANRDVGGAGERALAWLERLRADLEPYWRGRT
jgi:hypothetical protein